MKNNYQKYLDSKKLSKTKLKMKTTQLYDYLKQRASFENVKLKLSRNFFEIAFSRGTRIFFGIELDNAGKILTDHEQPEFWSKYREVKNEN